MSVKHSTGNTHPSCCPDNTRAVEIRIPSDANFVRVVRLAVSGVASMMPFTYDEVEDIKLAVSEACNNAIQHAHDTDGSEEVVVEVTMAPDYLAVSVQDRGCGIPPDKRSSASVPPEELPEQGLGLFLIQALMDEVQYETSRESGTRVRMIKRVTPDIPHPGGDGLDGEQTSGA